MSDIAMIRQALGCSPDMAALVLADLRTQRALDALYRAAPDAGDFIDFTLEDRPALACRTSDPWCHRNTLSTAAKDIARA